MRNRQAVKFYRKVWNAKIKEQVIQQVECGFLLVHFQWFSTFIMLKFSNEHDQMICRISNCTAHSKLRTSMFSLELWEEVVSTPSNFKRHCIALKTELVTESWWNPEMTKSHRPVRMNVIKFRIKLVFRAAHILKYEFTNVCHAEKRSKHSSNTILCSVRFSV